MSCKILTLGDNQLTKLKLDVEVIMSIGKKNTKKNPMAYPAQAQRCAVVDVFQ